MDDRWATNFFPRKNIFPSLTFMLNSSLMVKKSLEIWIWHEFRNFHGEQWELVNFRSNSVGFFNIYFSKKLFTIFNYFSIFIRRTTIDSFTFYPRTDTFYANISSLGLYIGIYVLKTSTYLSDPDAAAYWERNALRRHAVGSFNHRRRHTHRRHPPTNVRPPTRDSVRPSLTAVRKKGLPWFCSPNQWCGPFPPPPLCANHSRPGVARRRRVSLTRITWNSWFA